MDAAQRRVVVWPRPYMQAPSRASGAAEDNASGEGRRATITPTKPMATAPQRSGSTSSRSSSADKAVTMIGAAM